MMGTFIFLAFIYYFYIMNKGLTANTDKKLDLADRLELYVLGKRSQLSARDLQTYNELQVVVNYILARRYSKRDITKSMQKQQFWGTVRKDGMSESRAYQIYNLAQELFPHLMDVNKKVERIASYNKYKELATKAENAGDLQLAMQCYSKADSVMGLFDGDDTDGESRSIYFGNVVVVRSSDPQAFYDKQERIKKQLLQGDD